MTTSKPVDFMGTEFMGHVDWNFDPKDWKPNEMWVKQHPETKQSYMFLNGKWTEIAAIAGTGISIDNYRDKELERYRLELAQARARISTLEKYIIDQLLKEQP